ncbi:UPAR/Ly6 domain-containing protein bero-like [Musca autumnalis]|uniref:UPAR/Ly6 domain-containing protein bero-like n=1 Tax=Musca autumnalis TaxID=221902 RepID=UPI003CEBB701
MRFLLLIAVLITVFATGLSIKCYQCDSMTQPQCNEYFSPKEIDASECDDEDMPAYLTKYGQRFEATGCLTKIHEGIEGNRFFIRRSCYFGDLENTREACETEDPYLPYADLLDCEVCSEDLCNTDVGQQSKPTWYTIAAFLIALIFARMW